MAQQDGQNDNDKHQQKRKMKGQTQQNAKFKKKMQILNKIFLAYYKVVAVG
jgi:hypothetical protein